METPKIDCPSMWKSIHVDVDGYITPCCIHIHDEDKKFRLEDVDHAEKVLKEDFEVWRQQMIRGEWPDSCHQCRFAEEEGRSSKRQQDLKGLKDISNYNVELEYLQLKTGRICNLRCTICCPACSTAVAKHELKYGHLEQDLYDKLNEQIAWSNDINQYYKLNSKKGYYRIDIAGGEPLLNQTHFDWLNNLSQPRNAQLLYNTNGTLRPNEEQIQIWEKFKGIWMAFSIDSYAHRFEALRVGANWKNVLSNLKYFQEELINKRFNKFTSNVSIVMTVHAENVMDIIPLYEILTNEINFSHRDPLNLNYLYYPEFRSIHHMSKKYIEQIITLFDRDISKLPSGSKIEKEVLSLKQSMETFLVEKEVDNPRPNLNDLRNETNIEFIKEGIQLNEQRMYNRL